MSHTIIGIFDSSTEAQNAVENLSANGFTIDQVDITYDNQHSVLENVDNDNEPNGFGEKISRFFKSMFDSDEESTRYTNVARHAAIVTVVTDTNEEALRAAEILDSSGAIDVDERSRQIRESTERPHQDLVSSADGALTTDALNDDPEPEETVGTRDRNAIDTNQTIPVIEEQLHVDKREVDKGTVRLRSRIVEKPVEQIIRLREERVTVERNPVNRPVREGDLSNFREGEIEIKQRAEVPVVNKEARVVEEVNVNKEIRDRDEVIRDTVRRTEVDIDNDSTFNKGESSLDQSRK
ncbi:YsnF/AvaK domain-containing protein [Chryseosolibacter indicus]|uniref:DUF2382 domain-containing protein n=1 Tax=Chryseosolibacter indicus TaxID=2782351 RepID=A0ABS5VL11_9BACT|nr:YsnF/AvaK domain-containing protein [Chryseosolibacter indicus]MBT1702133.1 DUF2382 domain-containing protein [Chryseosolibacter indicus]